MAAGRKGLPITSSSRRTWSRWAAASAAFQTASWSPRAACTLCRAARAGLLPGRTQDCVAVSGDSRAWWLLNASPDLGAQLREEGDDALDTDFALQEFLDRYGTRLAQLGTILNLVAPLAEACPPPESI